MKRSLLTTFVLLAATTTAADSNQLIANLPAHAQAVAKDAGAHIKPHPPLPRVATKEEMISDKCHRLLTNLAELDSELRLKRQTTAAKENTAHTERKNSKLVETCQRLCEQLDIETDTDWIGIEKILNGQELASTLRKLNFSPTTIIQQLKQIINQIQNPSNLPKTYPPTFIPITQSDITDGQSCGYTISSPGSYRLIEDITVAPALNGAAFCIQSNYVTLDLNGHTLTANNSNGFSIYGINISPTYGHIIIRNGSIRLASSTGISMRGSTVLLRGTTGQLSSNITITDLNLYIDGNTTVAHLAGGINLAGDLDSFLINRVTVRGTLGAQGAAPIHGPGIYINQLNTSSNPYCVEVSHCIVTGQPNPALSSDSAFRIDTANAETTDSCVICKNNVAIGFNNTVMSGFKLELPNHSYVGNNISLNFDYGYELRTNQNVPFFNNYAHGNGTNYQNFGAGPSTVFPYDFSTTPTTAKYWTNVNV